MNNGFNARGCIVIAAKNKKIVESIKRNVFGYAETWCNKNAKLLHPILLTSTVMPNQEEVEASEHLRFIGSSEIGFLTFVGDFLARARYEMLYDINYDKEVLAELDANEFSIQFVFSDYNVNQKKICKLDVMVKHSAGEKIENSPITINSFEEVAWNEKNLADIFFDASRKDLRVICFRESKYKVLLF